MDSSDVETSSWEAANLAIRNRYKPLKVLRSGKFTRSHLTIGSLNIAGRESHISMHHKAHKFKFLKQTIDENNLGILGIQESHFDAESASQFNNVFNRWFKLYYPEKPCSTAGVAFVLNKKYLYTENIREYELIPGRAFMIVIPWHSGQSLKIQNIYAPDRPEERDEMRKLLRKKWAENPQFPFPNITLGDWNFVEDPLDRNSGAIDNIPQSFKILKHLWCLYDGWRGTFPDTRDYTCTQRRRDPSSNGLHITYSRIDRIKVDSQAFHLYRGWEIKHCPVKSDHRLVLTQLTCRPEEQPGKGRWNMPLYLLKTPKFMKRIQALAAELVEGLKELEHTERDPKNNIQTL
jgi:exonuclease III